MRSLLVSPVALHPLPILPPVRGRVSGYLPCMVREGRRSKPTTPPADFESVFPRSSGQDPMSGSGGRQPRLEAGNPAAQRRGTACRGMRDRMARRGPAICIWRKRRRKTADVKRHLRRMIFVALATNGYPAPLAHHSPTAALWRGAEIRRLICVFGSGSRRQIRQYFHPGTLYIPSEHYRTDAKPSAADEYSVFKKTV